MLVAAFSFDKVVLIRIVTAGPFIGKLRICISVCCKLSKLTYRDLGIKEYQSITLVFEITD